MNKIRKKYIITIMIIIIIIIIIIITIIIIIIITSYSCSWIFKCCSSAVAINVIFYVLSCKSPFPPEKNIYIDLARAIKA